jgi:hypothetical protein
MTHKKVTYEQLREALGGLGYTEDAGGKGHVTFRKPGTRLYVILPRMTRHTAVEPIHLLSVRKILANNGDIPEQAFESLFEIKKGDKLLWTEPVTGQQLKVTAAADESDGTVIIQQNGALSPCPVGQVRKVTLRATTPDTPETE